MNRVLYYFTLKYQGDWESIYNALSIKEHVDNSELEKTLSDKPLNYISLLDFTYPNKLKAIYKPPISLFYEGDFRLLNQINCGLINFSKEDIQTCFLNNDKSKNIDKKLILCIDYNEKDLINFLLKNKIRFVAIVNRSIEQIKKEDEKFFNKVTKNNLVLTEYPKTFELSLDKNNALHLDKNNSLRILSGLGQFLIMGIDKKDVNRVIFEQIYIHKSINPDYATTNTEWMDKLKFHLDCANDKEKTLAKQIRIVEQIVNSKSFEKDSETEKDDDENRFGKS